MWAHKVGFLMIVFFQEDIIFFLTLLLVEPIPAGSKSKRTKLIRLFQRLSGVTDCTKNYMLESVQAALPCTNLILAFSSLYDI